MSSESVALKIDSMHQHLEAIARLIKGVVPPGAPASELERTLALALDDLQAAEGMLRQQSDRERFLANVLELSSQPFGVGYPDGRLGMVNQAFCELVGYSAAELGTIGWNTMLTPPEWLAGESRKLADLQNTGRAVRYEKEYTHKSGRRIPVELFVHLVRNEGDQKQYYYAFVTDITERKRMEKEILALNADLERRVSERTVQLETANRELRESEAKFSLITRNSPDHIIMQDADLRYTFVLNPQLGLTEQAMLGKTDYGLGMSQRDAEDIVAHKREVMATGRPKQITLPVSRPNGATEYFEGIYAPKYDEQGHVDGVLGYFRNITERKIFENKLIGNEKRFRGYFELPIVGIAITSPARGWVEVNDHLCNMLGYSREELVQRTWSELTHPDDLAADLEKFNQVLEGKIDAYAMDKRFVRKNGEVIWVSLSLRCVRFAGGSVDYFVALLFDITERKRAEAERVAMEAKLLQMQKLEAIGTLAGGVAHDFNNILTAISGYSDLIMQDTPEGSEQRTYLDRILKATARARDLVKQILMFSRKIEPQNISPIVVRLVVQEALKLLRPIVPSNIDIRLDVDPGDTAVFADPTNIHQIIVNLCTNAYLAMREKGGAIVVALKPVTVVRGEDEGIPSMAPGRYLVLAVKDTGIGMSRDVVQRIFEPYFTTRKTGDGTGLGLSVVHGIVKGIGGHISVDSEPGRGTTFKIYMPAAEVVPDQGDTATREDEDDHGTERILIVDDDPDIAKLYELVLGGVGYTVTAVSSATEALELFKADPNRYDLVISDMTMPVMTGLELVQKMFGIRPGVPAILCTGFSDCVDEASARDLGIAEYLMKPVTRQELLEKVRRALGREGRQAG